MAQNFGEPSPPRYAAIPDAAIPDAAIPDAAPLENRADLHGARILVVDDELDARRIVSIVLRAAGALVLPLALVLEPDVAEQPRQQRDVDLPLLPGGVHLAALADPDADLLAHLAQLGVEVLPLAHAQVVEVLGDAALAELVARELAARRSGEPCAPNPGTTAERRPQ